MTKKTTVFENGLIWFGAAVSIAEIMAGTSFAPLGFSKGLTAIFIGHFIGCALLFLAGLIGGRTGRCAMDTVKMSFGRIGYLLFAILNIIQLIGWTAIMIYDGALAASGIYELKGCIWQIIIGVLIMLWVIMGVKNLGKINVVAMTGLFLLTLCLSFLVFRSGTRSLVTINEAISFGAAVELSVAMPLSWLPLISDYTKDAQKPVKATAVSVAVYGAVSCWMYIIGMGAAILTGENNIAQIMMKSGMGTVGLLVVVFSTVTTTFLDAHSAGISAESISTKLNGRIVAILTVVIGIVAAAFLPLGNITGFLYFIGSVFAPMISIQIMDFFVLKKDCSDRSAAWSNLVIWFIGFIIYRYLMRIDLPLGSTFWSMIITAAICISANYIKMRKGCE